MKKWMKKALLIILLLIIIVTGAFFIYASYYYKADDVAIKILENEDLVRVQEDFIVIPSTTSSDTALIFYPGAKVEFTSYLPILEKLSQNGITSVLIEMPLNFAILDSDAADEVFDELPEINYWYIGGHSMGGAMASSYAAENAEKIEGLVLLGAYIYGGVPPEDALTLYPTFQTFLL